VKAPRPIRIVEWPSIALLGLCALLLALNLVALILPPAPTTTPVIVRLGQTAIECVWYEDRANHRKSLSC
jgi:hypothetical protein